MPDYCPLIARAVAKLETNNREARYKLYERARAALLTQMRAGDPPYTDLEITRERLALEDAIRKLETEQLQIFAGSGRRSFSARR